MYLQYKAWHSWKLNCLFVHLTSDLTLMQPLHWVQSLLLLRSKIGELLRLPRPLCLIVDSSRDMMKFCGFPRQYFVGTADDSAACEFGGLGSLMSSVTLLCHAGSACTAGHSTLQDNLNI